MTSGSSQEEKQITLALRVVNGLKKFNSGILRSDVNCDKKFVKVLLVSCIGIMKIAQKELDPLVIDFIKGTLRHLCMFIFEFKFLIHSHIYLPDLFVIRVENRSNDFQQVLESSCDDLLKGNFSAV